jgi:hypothetical protein|tara:strand:+ start:1419 stop:1751 length:333 start_codon:yes stop_codon:yes gene_type:complete
VLNNAPRDKVNRIAAWCANWQTDPICRTFIDESTGQAQYGKASEMACFSPLISMTPKQRLDRALQIRAALTDLMTDEESDNYEGLDEHFQDYINDLTLDHQQTLPALPSL